MKMNVGIIGGIILILLGLSLIIKIVFNVDFPVFKILVALVLIYFGLRIILGDSFHLFHDVGDQNTVVFGERRITQIENGREYNVIFGAAHFDLKDFHLPDSQSFHIKINTIFGGTQITLNDSLPVRLNANTAFGGTKAPDGNTSAFGDLKYESDTAKMEKPALVIESNTVFGGLNFRQH